MQRVFLSLGIPYNSNVMHNMVCFFNNFPTELHLKKKGQGVGFKMNKSLPRLSLMTHFYRLISLTLQIDM